MSNKDLYYTIYDKERGFFPWKGRTFTQITTKIQQNKGSINNIFKATPLRLYRREIASNMDNTSTCNPRTSLKIDEFDRPNGSLVSSYNMNTGIQSVIDSLVSTNTTDHPNPACSKATNCYSQEMNALRRVRSGGMNRKTYNACTNSDTYNANTAQYLKSRNKNFDKNQFVYKSQDSVFKPSNTKFKQQGGVDAGSLINRVKYDALRGTEATFTTPKGDVIHNTLAYAVPREGFTKKGGKPFPLVTKEMIKHCTLDMK
jgi:hypothetical protein